jgi:hypothetical protein
MHRQKLALVMLNGCLLCVSGVIGSFYSDGTNIGDKVDSMMRAFSREEFIVSRRFLLDSRYIPGFLKPRQTFTAESGVLVSLPSGNQVRTGFLERQARPIIDLGPDSVPYLCRWVRSDNHGVRFIAIYSLESITNVKPIISRPGPGKEPLEHERAIGEWMNWWKSNSTSRSHGSKRQQTGCPSYILHFPK